MVDLVPPGLPLTDPATSARMRKIRQADTDPEQRVRAVLRSLGATYRICVKALPGSPDIANRRGGWAIFVHGCFWHGHSCRGGRLPKTNTAFWEQKIDANQKRDANKCRLLRRLGFRVLTVWQCETKYPERLAGRLQRFLG